MSTLFLFVQYVNQRKELILARKFTPTLLNISSEVNQSGFLLVYSITMFPGDRALSYAVDRHLLLYLASRGGGWGGGG
jgi:hypothetical protein